jgi:hypothetical protein
MHGPMNIKYIRLKYIRLSYDIHFGMNIKESIKSRVDFMQNGV